MFSISRDFQISYGHRILGHSGKCAHLHGHNATVRIVLTADSLNAQGMVVDFGELKHTVGYWLESELDHRTLLFEEDPLVDLLRKAGEPVVILSQNPTAEYLAKYIFETLNNFGFSVASVSFWETEKCSSTYSR